MKKLLALVFVSIFCVAPAYAGPSFSAGGGGGGSSSLTIATDCSSVVEEGAMCWDSDNNVFYIGDGAAAAPIGPGAGAGTITNVWTVATGNVNALVAASGDTFSAASADSSIPWVVSADCSAVVAEGRACWDSGNNILYIGDGATQIKVMKSGAIVNADLSAGAAIAFSKLAALTDGNILVGNGSNVATSVAVSGDVTIANTGAITIGDDKILEKHLKAVDTANDEDILTYEATTGDFEWHTIVEMLAKIGDTRGSILRRGASGWEAVTPGTVSYPLVSAGAGADPAYSQIVAAGITNNTITATQLSATLTFSDGDLIDLSGITQSTDTNEGLILPTWANVTTTGLTNGAIAWDESSKSLKVKSASGWQSIGATAAPVDATYLTLSNNATLTGERVLTEGLAIDFTDSGADGTLTIAFDPTELTGDRTWAAGGAATVAWTWNVSTGTDPSITFGNDLITLSNSLTVATGKNVKVGTTQWNSGDSIDGTKVANADLGDITVSSGVWAVEDDSHAHTSSTLPATTAYTDAANQTFTGAAQAFGDADTDTLTIRSMIIGGNSREVQINASTRTAPTYPSATPTQDLYVKGNVETPGTVYAASFNTGPGTDTQRKITMTTNTALTPTGDDLYYINDVFYFAQAGVQKTPMRLEDAQTATGKKTFQGDIAVGDATNSGSIDIYDGSSNYWQITVPSLSSDYTLTLPTGAGTTGQYLKTTTTGASAVLSWDTPAASADTVGGTGGVQFNAGGVLTSDVGFVFETATDKLSLGSSGGATTGTLDLYYTGTTYAATLTPNASMSADVTITMPSYTTTLLGSGANVFTGVQSFSTGTFDATNASQSIPWPVGTSASPFTADGAAYWKSNSDTLSIGDGATKINLAFTANSTYTFPTATATLQSTTGSLAANTVPSMAAGDLIYASSGTAIGRVAAGATTEILVGGGAAVPVWTTATGTGAPARAGSPTFTTKITTPLIDLGTGISVTGGAGVVTFTDLAGTGEALTLDLRTADTAKLTTTTSVGTFDMGALNVVTTGTMSGKMPTVVYSADGALNVSTAQARANTFFVNTYANTLVMTLPAAEAGMAVCLRNGQNNNRVLQVHSDGTDYLVLPATGVRNTAANHFAATASPTNQICLVAFDTTDWYITSTVGTWAAE
jgi:hypothetical protein